MALIDVSCNLEPPASDLDESIIPIPYGHADIVTSPELNALACVVYRPLHILICVLCGTAIPPSQLKEHRRAHHGDPKVQDSQITILKEEHRLLADDILEDHGLEMKAIPGIPYRKGWRCPYPGCSHGRKSG